MRSSPSSGLEPLDQACVAFAAVLLGHALQINNGFYDVVALGWLGLSMGFLIAGATGAPRLALHGWDRLARPGQGRLRQHRVGAGRWASGMVRGWFDRLGADSLVSGVLLAGILSNFLALAVMPPAFYIFRKMPHQHSGLMAGLGAATVLAMLTAFDRRRAQRLWFPLLLAVYVGLGAWLIQASPRPRIDVMTVHRAAIDALLDGTSPYSVTFPNIYKGTGPYSLKVVEGSRVLFGLPYPPLSLLMVMPADLLAGDIRWAELTALLAGAAFIGFAAPGRVGPLAATLLLFTPRTFFVLEQAWTESLAIWWLGATVYAAARGRGWLPIALGLLIGVKQHLALALLFSPWLVADRSDRRGQWRLAGQALAVAAAFTLPFLIWDPPGFWRSVVWLQFVEPFRLDSLSVLPYLVRQGWPMPAIVQAAFPLVATIVGLLVCWRWLPRDPSGFALGIAIVLVLVFAFSKKAFCNYYFFVLAAMVTGLGAVRTRDAGGTQRAPT